MKRHWYRYVQDPQVAPLVRSYNQATRELNRLKSDLRSARNIDAIIEVSRHQLAIHDRIEALVGEPEEWRRRDEWSGKAAVMAKVLLAAALLYLAWQFGWLG